MRKGDGLKAGESIQVTAWQAKRRPSDWVGASGQGPIPKKGAVVRAYFDRGRALLLPNGIDIKPANGKGTAFTVTPTAPAGCQATGGRVWFLWFGADFFRNWRYGGWIVSL
ncbi:MAG: hypothetical protein JNM56_34580 [Planctomycetia bacterium]|nr:hypothetical protein [Planctomycetia bacterium]